MDDPEDPPEVQRLRTALKAKDAEIAGKDGELARLQGAVAAKDRELAALAAELTELKDKLE